jgi:methionyl-tRNA formyltransferase
MGSEETALTLNMKCYEQSIQCFAEVIDVLAEDQVRPIQQNLDLRSNVPWWKRPPAACTINWTCSAEKIDALFRGLEYGNYPNQLGLPKIFLGDHVREESGNS